MYGYYPSRETRKTLPLKPAMSIRARIGFLKTVVGTEELSSLTGRDQRLAYAVRSSTEQLAFKPVDGAFRFPDVPPGPYEGSFGHRESDGSWISRGSTRIVAVGDSLFLNNQMIESGANRDFAILAVNWLLDRGSLLGGIGPQPVREYKIVMTQGQMRSVRRIIIGAMPGGVLLLGLLVWFRRQH